MKRLMLLLPFLLVTQMVHAAESSSSPGQFELDKDLVNSIYREAVTEAKIETKRGRSRLRIATEFSYLIPTTITLSNQYFDVQYSDFSGLPSFGLTLSQSVLNSAYFTLSLVGRTGFSRKEALTTVHNKSGAPFRDMVQLSRIPLLGGFRLDWIPSETAFVKPFFEGSAGIQWLYQSGKLDKALEQGFWIPFYQVALGLNLFGGASDQDWFGGVNIGGSLQRSFSSTQVANSWALDAGVVLYL